MLFPFQFQSQVLHNTEASTASLRRAFCVWVWEKLHLNPPCPCAGALWEPGASGRAAHGGTAGHTWAIPLLSWWPTYPSPAKTLQGLGGEMCQCPAPEELSTWRLSHVSGCDGSAVTPTGMLWSDLMFWVSAHHPLPRELLRWGGGFSSQ